MQIDKTLLSGFSYGKIRVTPDERKIKFTFATEREPNRIDVGEVARRAKSRWMGWLGMKGKK